MNASEKGMRNERKAIKILEARGFQVERRIRGRFTHDFFGLYDLIALNEREMILVQVKTNTRETKPLRARIKAHKVAGNVIKQVWVFKDRIKEPKIYTL